MLGLSEGISTCLFDLDGVVTQAAKAHRAARKEAVEDALAGVEDE